MSTNKFQYWPSNGQLGSTKFTIPTNAEDWPSGDALVGNFVYSEGKLVDFIDIKALVANESKSTTFPYDYVNIQVDKSLEDVMTFNGCAKPEYLIITYTESGNSGDTIVLGTKYLGCKTIDDIKAVDANYMTNDIIDGVWNQSLADLEDGNPTNSWVDGMFSYRSNLTTFVSDLSSLTNGYFMFRDCTNLTTFTSDLNSLTNGYGMFYYCTNLTSFVSDDMSSLTDSRYMFQSCSNLTTFTSDLSSLTDGSWMFLSCSNLTTFTSDLSSLTNGNGAFSYCSNLTTFTSDLSSLTNGSSMFYNCKLDTISIQNIAETINDVRDLENDDYDCYDVWKTIDIGIGNTAPNTEEDVAFQLMTEKGWTVYVNGGSDHSYYPSNLTTLDEIGEEISTPIPFYAKPIQTDEKHGRYMDSEGNYFNILGGQFIYGDDISTYGMFTSLEDAAANMRLTKIEK